MFYVSIVIINAFGPSKNMEGQTSTRSSCLKLRMISFHTIVKKVPLTLIFFVYFNMTFHTEHELFVLLYSLDLSVLDVELNILDDIDTYIWID